MNIIRFKEFFIKKKKILIAGTAVCAALLAAGFLIPVRLEVEQKGTLHQHTALTEDDFSVQAVTLFGIKRKVNGYSVDWNGWTKEQQEKVAGKYPAGDEEEIDKDDSGNEKPPKDADESGPDKSAGDENGMIVTGDTVTEYTVSADGIKESVTADAVEVKEIRAEYGKKIYQMEVPDTKNITAKLIYQDGAETEIPCTADETDALKGETDIPVHTEYGDTVCHITPIMPKELSAEYKGKVHSGEKAEAKKVKVNVTFTDGHKTETKAEKFLDDTTVYDPGDLRVKCPFGETKVHIDPIPVVSATIDISGNLYEEDILEFDTINLNYKDGKSKTISKDDVEMGPEASMPLTAGQNRLPFTYKGRPYTLTVDVFRDTEIRRASIRYAEEIQTAEYSHLSDTIMVTVNRYTYPEYTFLLTHIIIDDPSQIHAGLSNDDYGGERETPSSAAQRLGWVVGINGSNFDYATNTPTMADAIIKNGQVMPDSKAIANGMEICLTNGGNLFSPQQGMTIDDLLSMGVTDTWCCGDTLLISNGEAVNVGIQSLDYRYPRTAIGMVRPCEYYLITAGETGYSNGMTYDEIRDTLMGLDCGFGKCLDGGGSSTLIFENQMLNSPATGSERPVTDFLYFTE